MPMFKRMTTICIAFVLLLLNSNSIFAETATVEELKKLKKELYSNYLEFNQGINEPNANDYGLAYEVIIKKTRAIDLQSQEISTVRDQICDAWHDYIEYLNSFWGHGEGDITYLERFSKSHSKALNNLIKLEEKYQTRDSTTEYFIEFQKSIDVRINSMANGEQLGSIFVETQQNERLNGGDFESKFLATKSRTEMVRNIIFGVIIVSIIAFLLKLILSYKKFGRKGLVRALENKVNYSDLLLDSQTDEFLKNIKKEIAAKGNQGYSFGLDTNSIMLCPDEIFQVLRNEQVIISRQVQNELDRLKGHQDREKAARARKAIKAIDAAQASGQKILIVTTLDQKSMLTANLDPANADDRIIGSYVKEQKQANKVIFITNDSNARITARNVGLDAIGGTAQ